MGRWNFANLINAVGCYQEYIFQESKFVGLNERFLGAIDLPAISGYAKFTVQIDTCAPL